MPKKVNNALNWPIIGRIPQWKHLQLGVVKIIVLCNVISKIEKTVTMKLMVWEGDQDGNTCTLVADRMFMYGKTSQYCKVASN